VTPIGVGFDVLGHRQHAQASPVVCEFHDLHWTGVVLHGLIICKRKTARALNGDEQTVGAKSCGAKNEAAAG